MERLYIGTSGWSYPHWVGKFYPQDMKSHQFFLFYTRHFNTVEINSSFYHLPRKTTTENWFKRSPENFRFCPKLSRFITHQKKLINVEEPLHNFFEVFAPLKPKMGPILVQLPPGLKYSEGLLRNFLEILKSHYADFQFALEVRNESWNTSYVANILREYQVAFVAAHSGGRFPYMEFDTAPFVYYRFHGPGHLYASNYPEDMLNEFARKIRRQLAAGKTVWGYFNNDVGGYAIENARRLIELVTQ